MIELLEPRLRVHRGEDGLVLESAWPLREPARAVGDWLVKWARIQPEETFLAERDAEGRWVHLGYGEALEQVEAVASGLLARGGTPDRPLMILSDNSIDAALLALGAMHAGLPVAPVSPAYSLLSKSFGRLCEVAEQLRPRFIFADERERFAPALAALEFTGAELVGRELREGPRSAACAQAFAALGPDTVAKVLFTSGSTGRPKGVVNTQRMLTANQESLAACWPFLKEQRPVVVDWLPWSHTFGGNHNFFLVLRSGGSLYLDRGRPVPGLIETTLANLAEIGPTLWFNVPRGFDQAVTLLENDDHLALRVFRNLALVFYAAAALSPSTRARLERVAREAGRPDVFFTSSWGSTETAPLATSAHFVTRSTGVLGVPVPGVQLKLAPVVQDRLELRVRGPNVTPGHWQPGGAIAPVALDADGFLPTGDAGCLADEAHPEKGVIFRGRLAENFKLSSGTWVSVAELRIRIVEACAPLLLDAVVAGHDREALGLLLFLAPAAKLVPPREVEVRIQDAIRAYNLGHPANSEKVQCALVETEPLSLDAGETTDKGYTNQRGVLARRAEAVERLFAGGEGVLRFE